MHQSLTDHPGYKRAVAEVARIKGAQARHQAQLAKAEAEYRAAADHYQAKAIEALREGVEAPERPTPPEVDAALVQQLAYDSIDSSSILRAAERELAPELLPQLEVRAFEIEETIRQAADTMRSLAREASEVRVTAAALRSAAEFPPLLDPGAVDVGKLFELIFRGDRLLAAESARPGGRDVGAWELDAPRGSQKQPFRMFMSGGRR